MDEGRSPVAVANPDSHVSTIIALAQEIAQVAPDCADRALKIIEFARELADQPDRAMVEDAIESQLIDGELSEPQLQSVTSAIVGSIRTVK
jgi:hypothetical protein